MLRVVLGVALAAALLAVVTPALEDARMTRTERLTARELDRVASATETLAREESSGARRTLTVSLPGESATTTPLAFVSLGGVPDSKTSDGPSVTDTDERDVLAFRIAGGSIAVRRVGVELRVVRDGVPAASDSRPLVLDGGTTYRLTLRLIGLRGRLTVVVGVRDSWKTSGLGKPALLVAPNRLGSQ